MENTIWLATTVLLSLLSFGGNLVMAAFPQNDADEAVLTAQNALKPEDVPSLIQKAESGDLKSELVIGFAYFLGHIVKKDPTEASRWFHKGVDKGSALAHCGLGQIALTITEDYTEAQEWLSKAAQRGNQCGEFFLGTMYHDGQGVSKNLPVAAEWYRKAAEQSGRWRGLAEKNLAEIADAFESGEGVKQDYAQAAKWHRVLAEWGIPKSQFRLGLVYAEGVGVPKDEKVSGEWFQKAADQGYPEAESIVGLGYLEKKNYSEAAKWLEKAANQGVPEAQLQLAYMYTNGQGLKQDDAESVKWATKAAENGRTEAFHLLGFTLCCRIPSTIHEDDVASYMWFSLADQAGDQKAKEFLAGLVGQGMKKKEIAEARRRTKRWLSEHPGPASK